MSLEDAEELFLATIKLEYENWANNRTNISKKTDDMLQSILNGHKLNNIEDYVKIRIKLKNMLNMIL